MTRIESPNTAPTLNLDSLGKFGQGTMEKEMYYDIIIENQPNNDDAWAGKAVSHLKRGNLDEAFRCINKAVAINPSGHLGYRGWVKLYMLHDYQGALSDFNRLDSLTPNFQDAPWGEDIDKLRGICCLKMNQLEKGEIYFKEAIRKLTAEVGKEWVELEIFLYLGITQRQLGKRKLALQTLNEVLDAEPTNVRGLYEKAAIVYTDNTDSARVLLDSCLQNMHLQSTNPYFEIPHQLYVSDINALKLKIKQIHGN